MAPQHQARKSELESRSRGILLLINSACNSRCDSFNSPEQGSSAQIFKAATVLRLLQSRLDGSKFLQPQRQVYFSKPSIFGPECPGTLVLESQIVRYGLTGYVNTHCSRFNHKGNSGMFRANSIVLSEINPQGLGAGRSTSTSPLGFWRNVYATG